MSEDRDRELIRHQQAGALVKLAKKQARRWVPLPIRIERKRLMRLPSWVLEASTVAKTKLSREQLEELPNIAASKCSPLKRESTTDDSRLQSGKEVNVRRVAGLLDRIEVPPKGLFSYHHAVGRPSLLRGFALGPELREGVLSVGVGGGACQVTNMLFQLALLAGLQIVERHRHAIDLFADNGRTVPFGCGATVFYNMADLRFINTLPFAIALHFRIADGQLEGFLLASEPLPYSVRVFEANHSFEQDSDGAWWRSNVIRRVIEQDDAVIEDADVVRNRAEARYTPEDTDPDRLELLDDEVALA